MTEQFLIIGSSIVIALVIVIVVLFIVRKLESNYFRKQIKNLEIERNVVASTPVLLELSKVEEITKNNDLMDEKCNKWQDRFTDIKDKRLSIVDDMLIDLDTYIDKRDYKNCGYRIAKVQLEIYKVREAADKLLNEVKDFTSNEDKYRSSVTKLKSRYRTINQRFKNNRHLYGNMAENVELQLENISNKFTDFDRVMEMTDYMEAVRIVKAITIMVDHMEIVVNELPEINNLIEHTLPQVMDDISKNYEDMKNNGYSLEYLNIEYNIEESKKSIDAIKEKVKLLNLENCKFDLVNILNFFQGLYIDFEKERLSKRAYDEEKRAFAERIEKVNTQVSSVFDSLDQIKSTYNLTENDISDINQANKLLIVINDDYKKMCLKEDSKAASYSLLYEEIDNLTKRLNEMDFNFNKTLKSLGNMYDDEERAREQLKEIESFLKESRKLIHSYKLPVITDNYFVQLGEANEAIEEVINELEKKPIEIRVLNTRVDTARDLVLKLYNTTNQMIKNAKMAEMSIVYGNRYRSFYKEIDRGLTRAEQFFLNGNYKSSLDTCLNVISVVDKDIRNKITSLLEN